LINFCCIETVHFERGADIKTRRIPNTTWERNPGEKSACIREIKGKNTQDQRFGVEWYVM
jgi:hypothetical protein